MWLPLLLYMLLTSSANSQLSCDRISISFCCTTRIREQCPTQCANVNCDDGFIHSLFSIDSPKSQAKDGNTKTNVEGSTFSEIDTDFVVTKPDQLAPVPPAPKIENFATLIHSTTELPTTTSRSFATTRKEPRRRTTPDPRIIRPPESLVVIGDYDEDEPASENAVVFVDSPQSPLQTTTEFPLPPPTTSSASAFISNSGDTGFRSRKEISDGTASRSKPFYRRRASAASNRLICRIFTPGRLACDRRVRSLQAVGPPGFSPVPTSTTTTTTTVPPPISPRRRPIWRGVVRRPSLLSRDQRRRNFSTSRIQITPFNEELLRRRRKLDRGSSAEWKVSIIPRQQKLLKPDINAIPALTIDGKSDERFNKFYRNFGKVFNKMTEPDPVQPNSEVVSSGSIESSASIARPRTTVSPGTTNRVAPKISATTRGPPAVAPKTCGVAPDFVPCVSNEVASRELLACCQRKNLPAGCQSLCRYDVTQAEIRLAMDRGQCGIFSVAPFLECASQGKDNSECCRHRGILQKTGPQCEQFCRPAQGLTALGIQHLVCGGAVGDMLHCHHSGVRI
ncbi:unnamed protein product [Caenorhabditis angaria]|uniref:Domain of unknown function DB domain-containing protein n=1 Tax=Caenorhabditis angaria TaxID=860376 RepID=A0A9P1IM08_9PELO|nr:unnamed protein product [Caenorhabditis angaria]